MASVTEMENNFIRAPIWSIVFNAFWRQCIFIRRTFLFSFPESYTNLFMHNYFSILIQNTINSKMRSLQA